MAELAAAAPFDGLGLPLAAGGATLAALPAVRADAGRALRRPAEAASGAAGRDRRGLPRPGGRGGIVWAGMGQWLVEGASAGRRRLAGSRR